MPSVEILRFFVSTGWVAKVVLLILLLFSLASWSVILAKWKELGSALRASEAFTRRFRKATRLNDVAEFATKYRRAPLSALFQAGYAELEAQVRAARRRSGDDTVRLRSLDGVARALPALVRADKLQKRAARVGFDWPDAQTCLPKVEEELEELQEAMASGDRKGLAHEAGDLLFAVVNLVRLLGLDPEQVLRRANDRFELRFRTMERQLEETGTDPRELDLDAWEEAWLRAKEEVKEIE